MWAWVSVFCLSLLLLHVCPFALHLVVVLHLHVSCRCFHWAPSPPHLMIHRLHNCYCYLRSALFVRRLVPLPCARPHLTLQQVFYGYPLTYISTQALLTCISSSSLSGSAHAFGCFHEFIQHSCSANFIVSLLLRLGTLCILACIQTARYPYVSPRRASQVPVLLVACRQVQ